MERKKTLILVIVSVLIVCFILIGILMILYTPCSIKDPEPFEDQIVVEGLISYKKVVKDGSCKDYYFILNGTVEYQVSICTYEFFKQGDYCYITRRKFLSKDGISWTLILCDDFSNTTCIREPLLTILFFICLPLLLLCICFFYLFIKIGLPFLRIKIKKRRNRKNHG